MFFLQLKGKFWSKHTLCCAESSSIWNLTFAKDFFNNYSIPASVLETNGLFFFFFAPAVWLISHNITVHHFAVCVLCLSSLILILLMFYMKNFELPYSHTHTLTRLFVCFCLPQPAVDELSDSFLSSFPLGTSLCHFSPIYLVVIVSVLRSNYYFQENYISLPTMIAFYRSHRRIVPHLILHIPLEQTCQSKICSVLSILFLFCSHSLTQQTGIS